MAGELISVALGSFSQLFELLFDFPQLFVGKIFQIDQLISRLLQRANDFVELQMHRFSVAVLGVLDQLSSYLRAYPGKRAHRRGRPSEAVGLSPGLIFPPI